MLSSPFQKHVRPIYICVCELIRVAEAQIYVGLRGEVEDGINSMFSKHMLHIYRRGDVALLECKVWSTVEYSRVVEGCAVVEFIQGHDVIVGVRQDQMPDKPACSAWVLAIETY